MGIRGPDDGEWQMAGAVFSGWSHDRVTRLGGPPESYGVGLPILSGMDGPPLKDKSTE